MYDMIPTTLFSPLLSECRTALLNVDLITRDRGLLSVEKESTNMTRFLNRILGLPVRLQNHLFAYFTDTLASTIQHAKKTGRFDTGIFGRLFSGLPVVHVGAPVVVIVRGWAFINGEPLLEVGPY